MGLTVDAINANVRRAEYAVRGELAVKAEEFRARLAKGDSTLPFDHVISANIGNPQQLDQKPITFFRQVSSLLENPQLLENEHVLVNSLGYKADVVERARWLLKQVGSVGAYSPSNGVPAIKESVAAFLQSQSLSPRLLVVVLLTFILQDASSPADPAHIYLSAGASSGVNTLLNVICADKTTGIMIPIPQYPLYTATLCLLNATAVPYNLDESRAWGTDIDTINKAYEQAKAAGTDVRCIVIINPGNPTGASLSEKDIRAVIDFASRENLILMADEVYQTNVFVGKFHSFKGVLRQMQKETPGKYDAVELASLHSISKGMVGECGHRGGYFELVGFDSEVEANIYKFVSIMLCAPVLGQCLVELMVNPPKPGDPSYDLYNKEYSGIHEGLRERATALRNAFSQMEGVECAEPQGAMYLFPSIHLSQKAVDAAAGEGRSPDDFYCMRMLEATGICVIPGSGFGQAEGTLHFRTTFLAPGTEWVGSIVKFHKEFMDKYR
ncbi:Pyridoxal phosphate-dependent transferase, major domain protein [Ophiocordyceps sinensis CO18]|uniref:Glutamate pyruvate transaminase n=1 Tax=Ophiocordyceps sinensis (strain Co18 / CGMCC 3.14243) TaxID=911162 RepID=T5A747_OPHSC|nr:Pyridoxal phosphate-dependent transferase, major domain protein [Ophiocordyceps sinensis CO18]